MAVTGDNSTFKSSFRRHIVDSMVSKFDITSTDKYFLFVGKVDGWTAGGTFDSIADTRFDDVEVMRNIVGMKQIDFNSVYYMAPRYDWANNTIYAPYDDTVNMAGVTGYVLTNEYNVYKCMANNNSSPSSVEPKGIKTSGSIHTSDGYQWKYIYTIPEPFRYYIDDDYIPVSKLYARGVSRETKNQWDTQTSSIRGGIESLLLTQVNSNYTSSLIHPAGATGTNILSGSTAGATGIFLNAKRFKNDLSLSDGALTGLSINIVTGDGAGQRRKIGGYIASTAEITFDPPLVKAVPVDSKYEIVPSINIYGDGISAEAHATLFPYDSTVDNRKVIKELIVTNPGKDYTHADVEFAPVAVHPSAITLPVARAIIPPPDGHGSNAVRELNATTLLIVVNIDEDEDSNFFLANEVRQYGIIKNPVLNDSDSQYLTSTGYPYRIAGSNSENNTYLEIRGAGTGAGGYLAESQYVAGNYVIGKDSKATAKVVNWGPGLDRNSGILTVTNVQGNFIAPVDFTGTGEFIAQFSQSLDNWNFVAGTNIATVSAFDKVYQGTNPSFQCTTVVGVSGAAGVVDTSFQADASVTGGDGNSGNTGNPSATCLVWTVNDGGTGGELVLTDVKGSFATGDSIGSSTATSTTSVINTLTEPEIFPYSGEIIYAQNMLPIEKDPEQREQYQVLLKF